MTNPKPFQPPDYEALLEWLAPGKPTEARRIFGRIRGDLIRILASRGCPVPEDLADEAIERVARKAPELAKNYVGDPALYFHAVVRNVHREYVRRRKPTALDHEVPAAVEKDDTAERNSRCLDRCLKTLSGTDQSLILDYYSQDRSDKIAMRKRMAMQIGAGLNALNPCVSDPGTAFRLRDSLSRGRHMSYTSGFRSIPEDDTPIRDFLLGKTLEADREQFEERLLTDPDFSEWVSAIEEELIDDYTSGLLYGDERHRFEDCFLVTEERRRRVQFSAALARVKVPVPVRKSYAWMQFAAAALAAISLGAAIWMAYAMRQTRDELEVSQHRVADLEQAQQTLIEDYRRRLAEAEDKASAALKAAEARTPRSESGALPMVVATLFPGALRDPGTDIPSVRIPQAALLAEFRLELAEDSDPSYTASIHDPSGNEVFRVNGLKSETTPDRILVTLQVPAELLPRGDYSTRLWGKADGELTELNRYYVRIVRD